MSNRLTKWAYNILISTSLVVGGTLWFNRADNHVEPQDVLELRAGYTEVQLGSWLDVAYSGVSNVIYNPAGTVESGYIWKTYEVSDGATNLVSKPLYEMEQVYVGTYTTVVGNADFGRTVRYYDYTKKYLIGAYTNITVSGFEDLYFDESELNGIYTYVRNQNGILYYQSPAGCTMNYDGNETRWRQGVGEATYRKRFPPWLPDVAIGWFGGDQKPTATRGELLTNVIITAPQWEDVIIRNEQVVGNTIPDYDHALGDIDESVFGTVSVNTQNTVVVPSMLFQPTITIGASNYLSPRFFYVPEANYGVSDYTNRYALRFDMATVYSAIGITNLVNIGNGLFIYGLPDDLSPATNRIGYWEPSRHDNHISKAQLTARYEALKLLKTCFSTAHMEWKADRTNNVEVWYGSGTTWAEAVADFKLTYYGTENGRPYARYKVSSGSTYARIDGWKRSAKLARTNLYSGVDSKFCFYAYSTNYNGNANYIYDLFGETDLENGKYKKIDEEGAYAARSNAVSTNVYGDIDMEANIPDEPVDNTKYYGWSIAEEDMMIDWDFRYCR